MYSRTPPEALSSVRLAGHAAGTLEKNRKKSGKPVHFFAPISISDIEPPNTALLHLTRSNGP
jgi:hypothetical protein